MHVTLELSNSYELEVYVFKESVTLSFGYHFPCHRKCTILTLNHNDSCIQACNCAFVGECFAKFYISIDCSHGKRRNESNISSYIIALQQLDWYYALTENRRRQTKADMAKLL